MNSYNEVYATDNFLFNVKAHYGSACDHLYCGKKYSLAHIFGMKNDSDITSTLMYFIRTLCATKGLFSEDYKFHTGAAVKDVLCKYNIGDASGIHLST